MRRLYYAVALLPLFLVGLSAQEQTPTVTFQNQSGEDCVVKLVGPAVAYVDVPNGADRTVQVRGGRYYIITRYGLPQHYRFARGAAFDVIENAYSVSRISITLHKVANGNYQTTPDSGSGF